MRLIFKLRLARRGQFLLLLGMLAFLKMDGSAQVKYEKERRIKDKDVPLRARNVLNSFPFNKKIKWFLEENVRTSTYEAKSKHKGKWHSVEFDKNGTLQDVEVEIEWEEVSPQVRERIHKSFSKAFKKYKLRKIQIQYKGGLEAIEGVLKKGVKAELTIHYEVVVKGKGEGENGRYEYLFTESGSQVRKAKILQKNSDHLEF